jgi:hypothetical protein
MPILWCGGEDVDFPNGTVPEVVTTTGTFDAAMGSRCAVGCPAYGVVRSVLFTILTSFWWHGLVVWWGAANQMLWGVGASGTAFGLGINFTTDGYLQLVKYAGGTLTVLATSTVAPVSSPATIDLHVQNYGATATVTAFVAGVQHIVFTGDVRPDASVTAFDHVLLVSTTYYTIAASQFIVTDTDDTRLFSVATLPVAGAGDANTFSAGTYADINEVAINDANTAHSNTPEQDLQVALGNLPTGAFVVKAIKAAARLSDGVGGMGMQIGIKTNGVALLSPTIPLAGAWGTYERLLQQNPVTANNFTVDEINALQLACRSKAV